MDHKLSINVLIIALTLGAVVCFGAFVLYGAWIDGKRQKVRDEGLHPVTEKTGSVHASERENDGQ